MALSIIQKHILMSSVANCELINVLKTSPPSENRSEKQLLDNMMNCWSVCVSAITRNRRKLAEKLRNIKKIQATKIHRKGFSCFLLLIKSESLSRKMSLLCVHVETLLRDNNLGCLSLLKLFRPKAA
jgi:hypothetical protein